MEVTNKDILKHYLSSVLIYGLILLILFVSPLFNQNIENPWFSYFSVLCVYYILYVIFAYPIFKKLRPASILDSRNVIIFEFFKRQFVRGRSLEQKLSDMNLKENEKQSFMILFIKTFFGVYSLSLLCNKFLPQMGYNIDFLSEMFNQSVQYIQSNGILGGIMQYIDDTADMWLNLMFTLTTLIFAFSYLTEADFLKNRIKYADTTPLGIFSCLICFYPFILLTEKLFPIQMQELIPIDNLYLRISIYILVIFVNLISTMAILRLGTRVGNLTNRGIVTGFPYNVVRHPDYAMQICYVVLTMVPLYAAGDLNILGDVVLTIGMLLWIAVYVLRAVTEERNLIKDDDYKKYCEKVQYRFIPRVY